MDVSSQLKIANLFHSNRRCKLTDTSKTIDSVSLHCDKTCCMAAMPSLTNVCRIHWDKMTDDGRA